MKKRWIAMLLIAAITLTLSACASSSSIGHTIYIRDEYKHDQLEATLLSTDVTDTQTVKANKLSADDDATLFSLSGDTEKFDRIVLTYGDESTVELSFNDYISGWQIDSHRFMPYTYEGVNDAPQFQRERFDYEERKKDVCIWTPEDYDKNSEEKYSVIYMTDGQNLFDPSATSTGSWGVCEAVRGMMKESKNKCIIVGIENNPGYRDEELTPNLGKSTQESYDNGKGEYFCNFVYNTVVPFVEENYNVYTDPGHNAICGSSSGGIESFYIGMEHPEKFGTIGALSPAFGLFDNETWNNYLSKKDFSAGYPFVYIYCGNSDKDQLEQFLMVGAKDMPENLKKIGYPEDRITVKEYDKGMHNEMHWRAVFPDFLKYMFPQSNTQKGE